jgi:hypothetical protein
MSNPKYIESNLEPILLNNLTASSTIGDLLEIVDEEKEAIDFNLKKKLANDIRTLSSLMNLLQIHINFEETLEILKLNDKNSLKDNLLSLTLLELSDMVIHNSRNGTIFEFCKTNLKVGQPNKIASLLADIFSAADLEYSAICPGFKKLPLKGVKFDERIHIDSVIYILQNDELREPDFQRRTKNKVLIKAIQRENLGQFYYKQAQLSKDGNSSNVKIIKDLVDLRYFVNLNKTHYMATLTPRSKSFLDQLFIEIGIDKLFYIES